MAATVVCRGKFLLYHSWSQSRRAAIHSCVTGPCGAFFGCIVRSAIADSETESTLEPLKASLSHLSISKLVLTMATWTKDHRFSWKAIRVDVVAPLLKTSFVPKSCIHLMNLHWGLLIPLGIKTLDAGAQQFPQEFSEQPFWTFLFAELLPKYQNIQKAMFLPQRLKLCSWIFQLFWAAPTTLLLPSLFACRNVATIQALPVSVNL